MIKFANVTKKFGESIIAVDNINFQVNKGDFILFIGATGSGKTTIFRLLRREISPNEGKIFFKKEELSQLPSKRIPNLRRQISIAFQDLKLLFDRTVFENVCLSLEVCNKKEKEIKKTVDNILKLVGLDKRKNLFPSQLSGGELQRTAIARALILEPEVFLADEPTGNLDLATSWEIMKLLSEINRSGTTVLMATHNTDIIKSFPGKIIKIDKGRIIK